MAEGRWPVAGRLGNRASCGCVPGRPSPGRRIRSCVRAGRRDSRGTRRPCRHGPVRCGARASGAATRHADAFEDGLKLRVAVTVARSDQQGQWAPAPARSRGGSSPSGHHGNVRARGRPALCRPHRAAHAADLLLRAPTTCWVGTADGRAHTHVPGDAEQAVAPAPSAVPLGDVLPRRASPGPPPYPPDQPPTRPRPWPPRLLPPLAAAAPVDPTAGPSGPLPPHHDHYDSRSTFPTGPSHCS